MKTKISSFLLATTLFLSGFAGVSTLSAQTTPDDSLTGDKIEEFSTSVRDLLSLEDTPPTNGSGVAIRADIYSAVLNLLSSDEDYFGLYTAKAGSYITDTTTQDENGQYHHSYALKPGIKKKTVIGYLTCLDTQAVDTTVSGIASKEGSSSYTFSNHVASTKHILRISLEYDYLSQNLINRLFGKFYDPNYKGDNADFGTHIWIDTKSFSGDELKESTIPQNVFTLDLCVALDDSQVKQDAASIQWDSWNTYNYNRNDPDKNYTAKK
jgi:hypothetical protein